MSPKTLRTALQVPGSPGGLETLRRAAGRGDLFAGQSGGRMGWGLETGKPERRGWFPLLPKKNRVASAGEGEGISQSVNTNNLQKKPRKAKPKEASATLLQNCLVL